MKRLDRIARKKLCKTISENYEKREIQQGKITTRKFVPQDILNIVLYESNDEWKDGVHIGYFNNNTPYTVYWLNNNASIKGSHRFKYFYTNPEIFLIKKP